MDNHVRAGLATKVELRDAEGNLEHVARLTDLELGYDRPIEVGKFYVLPSLQNYYYCERIDDDLVSWVLVESYQHGHLIQAEIKQKLQYAGHYVEVTDEPTLGRLNAMLTHLKRPRERH